MDEYLESRINEAVKFIQNKDYFQAKKVLEEVLRKDPHHPVALHNMGEILYKMDNIRESNVYYEKAIKIKPDQIDSYFSLGMNANTQKNYRKALQYFQMGLKYDPNSIDLQVEISLCLYKLKEFEESLRILNKLHKLYPKNDEIMNRIGNYYCDQFQLKEAINWYNQALSQNPENEMYKKNLDYAQKLSKS